MGLLVAVEDWWVGVETCERLLYPEARQSKRRGSPDLPLTSFRSFLIILPQTTQPLAIDMNFHLRTESINAW